MYVNEITYLAVKWVVSAAALLLTAYAVPGFRMKDFPSALKASVLIGLANMFIRPVLLLLTLPLNILTLGLFTFVVNAMILKLCAWMLRGFEITSWFSALIGAVLLTIISTLLHFLLV